MTVNILSGALDFQTKGKAMTRQKTLLARLLLITRDQPFPLFVIDSLFFCHHDQLSLPTLGKPDKESTQEGECDGRGSHDEHRLREGRDRPRVREPKKHRRDDGTAVIPSDQKKRIHSEDKWNCTPKPVPRSNPQTICQFLVLPYWRRSPTPNSAQQACTQPTGYQTRCRL
jgi:hypothetical protein